jgi:hypothetical protein
MTASQRLRVVEPQTPSPLARSVEENLTSCKARGLSPKTVNQAYGWPLRSVFLPWDEEEGLRTPADVTPRALERLAANLLERPGRKGTLSRHSVHAYLRGVNQWSRWAKLEGEDVPPGFRSWRVPVRQLRNPGGTRIKRGYLPTDSHGTRGG